MEEKKYQNEPLQENKMGVQPINRLLISMSLPIMISMLVQAMYNVVDSIFVAQLSENALNAVSLAFPIQNLMIAVSVGTAVGINAHLSKSLGEKNFEKVDLAAQNGVFLAACSYLLFALIGIFFSRPFFLAQTEVQEIVDQGTAYIAICTIASPGLFMAITYERLLQSTGRTMYSMVTQTVGALTNIILDPIFIFVFDMGVLGAAVATVTGQIAAACLAVWFNARKNKEITLRFRGFRPHWPTIRAIYSVGLPSIVMSSIGSVMVFCLNKILIAFTTTATAVLGVYFKLQSFIFMPVFGMNNGLVPIVAYNYGARKPERVTATIKLCAIYATVIMAVGVAIFQVGAPTLLGFFDADEHMLAIGVPALRIISTSFVLSGACIVCSSTFQALGHGVLSLIISVVRQLIVLLPTAWLLSLSGELNMVWWAFPIEEVVSVALCAAFLRYVYRKEILPLKQ